MSCKRACRASIVSLVLLVPGAAARADEDLQLELFRPSLELSGSGTQRSSFEDLAAEFGQTDFGLKLNLPLGSTHLRPDARLAGYQVFALARVDSSDTEIGLLEGDRRLASGSLRAAGLMVGRGGNIYLASVGASFAEDEDTLDDIDPRFAAIGLATHRKSPELTFLYGGLVSYQYGRRLVLPLFGLTWRFHPKWSLFTAVPFVVKTTWRRDDKSQLHLGLAVSGDRYRFANRGDFPGEPETLFLGLVQTRIGAEWEYRPSANHALLAELGVVGGRRLTFTRSSDVDDEILAADIDPAAYVGLSWRLRFGKTLF